MTDDLKGRRIAIAETRELDLFAEMLAREGAIALRYPLVSICDTSDIKPVEAWIERVIAGNLTDIVFYTGEGVRRLLGFAERAGHREAFVAALAELRKITRGPKPVKALREIGLGPDIQSAAPVTDGIIAVLNDLNWTGRTVGIQIYGQVPNAQLCGFLESRGAAIDIVAPYVYASEADNARVRELIAKLAAGSVDSLVFTSSPQVDRIFAVAEESKCVAELKSGLARTRVAAIGPLVAAQLAAHGIPTNVMPETVFTLKPMVTALRRMFREPSA